MPSVAQSMQHFINNPLFAVVGASTAREKYGNKVLRWYIDHQLPVVPIHPRESKIEGLPAVLSASHLDHPPDHALSIITPPSVTLTILQECKRLGISRIWIQPGAEDDAVLQYCSDAQMDQVITQKCILVEGPSLLTHRSKAYL